MISEKLKVTTGPLKILGEDWNKRQTALESQDKMGFTLSTNTADTAFIKLLSAMNCKK